jgi:hypothetical protein
VKRFPVLDSSRPGSLIPEEIFPEAEAQSDRRSAPRYPIELRLRFRALGRGSTYIGDGQSVNISRRGMLVLPAADAPVPLGGKLETILEWPILLDGAVSLQLVTVGRVVRSDGRGFGVEFKRHTFRTTKRKKNRSESDLAFETIQKILRVGQEY